MRAALVLLIAGAELAAMITAEQEDCVVQLALLFERFQNAPHGLINLLDAPVIVRQLRLPVAGQVQQVGRNIGILKARRIALGRDEPVLPILKVRFQLREEQQ